MSPQAQVVALITENLGPVVLGVFVNTYLYGIVTFQYASYWTTKFYDPLWIKGTVLMLFLMDTVHSSSLIWMIWIYAVQNYMNPQALLIPVWPYPMTIVVTALTAFVTQFFLSYRIFRLTRGKLLYSGTIFVEVGTLGLGLFCSVRGYQVTNFFQLVDLRPYLVVWLCLETAIDLVICLLLLYTLGNSRTGFSQSDTVIRRLMRAAVQTGCFAGVFAVITLILFLTKPNTQLFSLTGIPISRIYSNTLMDTILCRGELRDLVQQSRGAETLTGTLHHNSTTSAAFPSVELRITKEIHTDVHYERRGHELDEVHLTDLKSKNVQAQFPTDSCESGDSKVEDEYVPRSLTNAY